MTIEAKMKQWRKVYNRDNYQCVYCDRNMFIDFETFMGIQIDHVIPVSRGGSRGINNQATACPFCNLYKRHYLNKGYQSMTRQQIIDDVRARLKAIRAEKTKLWTHAQEERLAYIKEKGLNRG